MRSMFRTAWVVCCTTFDAYEVSCRARTEDLLYSAER